MGRKENLLQLLARLGSEEPLPPALVGRPRRPRRTVVAREAGDDWEGPYTHATRTHRGRVCVVYMRNHLWEAWVDAKKVGMEGYTSRAAAEAACLKWRPKRAK